MKKIRIAVLFGGRSAEHEVSVQSARNVIRALDPQRYEVLPIAIDREGRWLLPADAQKLLEDPNNLLPVYDRSVEAHEVTLLHQNGRAELVNWSTREPVGALDVVFPVLHGPFGEDGTVQGLLKLADLPCVGAGVLGSAVGMDKDVMKRLLLQAGIPTARHTVFSRSNRTSARFDTLAGELGLPLFVKPANLGSSVGISKVSEASQLAPALELAFSFDRKVIVEEFVRGREIECSVLGNEEPAASLPGEVIPQADFYSYEAKYVDENGALLKIPADLDPQTVSRIQRMAVRTFQVLCCEGLARVDFFLKGDGGLLVNEINTIPGFTGISMYPKLWEASGLPVEKLIDALVQLALERAGEERKLRTRHEP